MNLDILIVISKNVSSLVSAKCPKPTYYILNIAWYRSHGLDTLCGGVVLLAAA